MNGDGATGLAGLRTPTPDDYPFLRELEQLEGMRAGGLGRGDDGHRDPTHFASELWANVHTHRVIYEPARGPSPLGLVTAYNASPRNRTAWLAVIARSDERRSGLGLFAFGLFISMLFREFDFRVLYAESDERTVQANFASLHRVGGLIEVGRLRSDRVIDGRPVDAVVLAIHRDQWEQGMGRVLRARAQARSTDDWSRNLDTVVGV